MSQIKERGILFKGEMVRALLDGRKTQTRRILKSDHDTIGEKEDGSPWPWREDCINGGDIWYPCPYGKHGDRLWVRETFVQHIDSSLMPWGDHESYWASPSIKYAADGFGAGVYGGLYHAKHPSIHMPRWASRILLEITDVRVERLQEISRKDAEAEGLKKWPHKGDFAWGYDGGWEAGHGSPTGAFSALWKSINGPESWDPNPWVWVVEFKRVPK